MEDERRKSQRAPVLSRKDRDLGYEEPITRNRETTASKRLCTESNRFSIRPPPTLSVYSTQIRPRVAFRKDPPPISSHRAGGNVSLDRWECERQTIPITFEESSNLSASQPSISPRSPHPSSSRETPSRSPSPRIISTSAELEETRPITTSVGSNSIAEDPIL